MPQRCNSLVRFRYPVLCLNKMYYWRRQAPSALSSTEGHPAVQEGATLTYQQLAGGDSWMIRKSTIGLSLGASVGILLNNTIRIKITVSSIWLQTYPCSVILLIAWARESCGNTQSGELVITLPTRVKAGFNPLIRTLRILKEDKLANKREIMQFTD